MLKRCFIIISIITLLFSATACANDPQVMKFKNDVDTFCDAIATLDESINQIDPTGENAVKELLTQLDEVEMNFKHFAELDFPKDYDYLEPIADEAESYMTEAVKSYHEAFAKNQYDETIGTYAMKNYERSMERIHIIIAFLHDENPLAESEAQ